MPRNHEGQPKHVWRFFRVGGFDQVRLDSGSDIAALGELDQKLWVALACPTRGIEFDATTLDLLDADHDGRLGLRELRTAWTRLAPWDQGKGYVTKGMLPYQYRLTLSHGRPAQAAPASFRPTEFLRGVPRRGPLWFRKMDRNGDGDVSPREWLGSAEDFKKIDTDGDGLISVEEAEKADAWFREKLKEKEKQ